MKYILLSILILSIQGCLKSKKVAEDVNQDASQIAYIPLVEKANEYGSTIALYKTEGTRRTTKKLYETISNVTNKQKHVNIFSNFTLFGSYVYYDYIYDYNVEKEDYVYLKQLRTHIDTGVTDELTDNGRVIYNSYYRTNRVVIGDTLYVKRHTEYAHEYVLEKYSLDGSSLSIDYPYNSPKDTLTHVPMVYMNHTLYIPTVNNIVSLSPKNDIFSSLNIDNNLIIQELVGVQNTLYLLGYNKTIHKMQLWSYNVESKNNALLLYTFGIDQPEEITSYVNGSKIYFNFFTSNKHFFVCFDTMMKTMVSLPKPNKSIYRVRNHTNLIYYSTHDESNNITLWQSNGTLIGTKKVLDKKGNTIKPKNLTIIHDKVYFANQTKEYGDELWIIDNKGVHLLIDIVPGIESSVPRYMSALNKGIVLQANKGATINLYYYNNGKLKQIK